MSTMNSDLAALAALDCRADAPRLSDDELAKRQRALSGWDYADARLTKTFRFGNYYETMAFVNAAAWVSHREDHHPDLEVGYNRCRVRYSTHSVGGLSENDFICAAKLEALQGL